VKHQTCTVCKNTYPLSTYIDNRGKEVFEHFQYEYSLHHPKGPKLYGKCRRCNNGRQVNYRATPNGKNKTNTYNHNPEKQHIFQKSKQKPHCIKAREEAKYKKYGITLNEYYQRLKDQNGVCAICKQKETAVHHKSKTNKPKKLAVDHNHITGEVRGLLCGKCNTAIGALKADEGTDLLLNALSYIEIQNLDK